MAELFALVEGLRSSQRSRNLITIVTWNGGLNLNVMLKVYLWDMLVLVPSPSVSDTFLA